MSQHTPGQPCDCHIIKRNGDPLTTADYNKDSPHAPSRIYQCPLHAAAPDLLAALENIIGLYANRNIDFVQARAAIAQAQGEKS